MKRRQNYLFTVSGVFAQYEEQAIDGQLDYDDFPPEEYRYFSKLSKLGYCNRHKGWTKETCEQLQEKYRNEYREACVERSERLQYMKRLQAQLIQSADFSRQLNTATTPDEALTVALRLIENLLNEPDLARRIRKNIQ